MLFSDYPFNDGFCSRFFLIKNLKYEQLTYSISAKVDGLFSPSYTQKTFASLLLIHQMLLCDPLHPISSY
jgi:hypothetical protein